MNWRPDICKETEDCVAGIATSCAVCQKIQDAMLEALRERAKRLAESPVLLEEHIFQALADGVWVFIPDDKKEQG